MPKGKPNEQTEIDVKCFHAYDWRERKSYIYVDKNDPNLKNPAFSEICDEGAGVRFKGHWTYKINVEISESGKVILRNDVSRNHVAEARINLKTKTAKIYCCNCDNFE